MESKGISRLSFLAQARLFLLALLGAPAVANAASAATPAPAVPPPSDPKLYMNEFKAFRGKTLEQRVQELADREEIRELIAKYAHRVPRGLSNADLFTEDGCFIVRAPGRPTSQVTPRSAIDKMYQASKGDADHPKPMIHNYVIEITGNEAVGICSNELRITENGKSIIASGYYLDTFRRENGLWKFVVRDANFMHWVPIQQGWATSNQPI